MDRFGSNGTGGSLRSGWSWIRVVLQGKAAMVSHGGSELVKELSGTASKQIKQEAYKINENRVERRIQTEHSSAGCV